MDQDERDPALDALRAAASPPRVSDVIAGLSAEATARPSGVDRPHVSLNMVSSVDGHATIAERSGGLSSRADRALFHGLRSITDAVLVGAGTARSERYGRIIPDDAGRQARERAGRAAEPLACIVSAHLSLEPDLPLLREPQARVVILTASSDSLPPVSALVEYVRVAGDDGQLDLRAALRELGARLGVREVLCEGGPSLNAELLAGGLVDELFLSLAPVLAGGADPLSIIAPRETLAARALALADVHAVDSHLFLRYRVAASDPLT